MTYANEVFKIYVETSSLLLVTWIMFLGLRPVLSGARASQALVTRLAQALVLTSLSLPTLLAILPAQKIPAAAFEIFTPKEGGLPTRKFSTEKTPRAVSLKSAQYDHPQTHLLLQAIESPSLSASLLLAVSLLAIVMLWRLQFELSCLRKILRSSIRVRKIGRVVISVSDDITIPFSTFVDRTAYVVVPLEMAVAHVDFRLAIAYEIQHHRRRDTAWARFIGWVICAFAWNPAAHLWKREIIQVQELACDEALIGQRRVSLQAYGSCLIKVAEAALGDHDMRVGTTCMAMFSKNNKRRTSFLRRRIDMFQSHKISKPRKAFGVVLGTTALLFTTAFAYGAQQAMKSPEQLTQNPGQISFDPDIQKVSEDTLAKYMKKFNAKAGFVLVSDPATGRLLAVANFSDDPKATANWSLSYELEPASAIKAIYTSTAIDVGVTTVDEKHDCGNGTLKLGNGTYHDWKPFTQPLTTTETILNSSNICGIRIAQKLGSQGLAKSLRDFGFGVGGTTAGFPQARAGQIPDPSQFSADDYVPVIALGTNAVPRFHVTPLEMVEAFGAIGNGGKLMKPLLSSAPDSSIEVAGQPISEQTSEVMKTILRKVVLEGTGVSAKSTLYTTAGKTSSAFGQSNIDHDKSGGERSMAGFAGFAPVTHPRVAIYVGIFEPHDPTDPDAHGNRHAAPVFREVAEKVLQHLGVKPDQN